MKKLLILPLLLFGFLTTAQLKEKITRIDSVLTYLYQRQLFNGTVLVGEKGKVIYKKAFGTTGPASTTALTTASAFNLASVSKQFFAAMILILKEQGKLTVDDEVQKHLPIFPYPDITIRQLMNHTSGLPEYFEIAERNMSLLDTLTNQSMLEMLAYKKPPLTFTSGTEFKYCNTNYTTLASIIEKVSGMTTDKFFQQSIVKPLKLKNTFIYHLKMKNYPPSRVFGFRTENGARVLFDLTRLDGIVGDGNIYSSVEDLYTWDQALYTEKLMKKATFQEAITSGKLNNGKETGYGFGWSVLANNVVRHTGGWVGFNTLIHRDLNMNQTLVLLDNSGNYIAGNLTGRIFAGEAVKLPQTHLINHVQLIDGTGMPGRTSAVRIVDDRIYDIGNLTGHPGESVTDGKGLVLAPGFIDSHSHHDRGLDEHPDALAVVSQGITTIVVGQDGGSDPIDSITAMIKATPISINLATYTGHSTLRYSVMRQRLFRKARQQEVDSMKSLLLHEMESGSLGLATGLEYESAFYAGRDEVIELAKVAASKGGRYISHIRSEDIFLQEAIDEIIDIGRQAKIPVQVSHIKIALRSKWETTSSLFRQFEAARAEGVDITADVYPYTMWSSTPRVLFPNKDFTNLKSATFATSELFDPAASFMVTFSADARFEGKTVSEIAVLNKETAPEALMRIIRDTEAVAGDATIAATSMSEKDVAAFIQWPHSNICSDGSDGGHPRGYGSFPRVLGRYVREQKLLPLETAIYKMTGLTAEHVGITNRGLITKGYYADLVLFNPATVIDKSTIMDSQALSEGIEMVWVNGKLVYQHKKTTGAYPGKFVKRK